MGVLLAMIAVCAFSTSALFARLSAPAPAVEATFFRLLGAGVLVLTAAVLAGQGRLPARAAWPRLALYGLATGLHFFFYILSLEYTSSAANSLALVYTAPAFVAVMAWVTLGERLTPRQMVGVAVVLLGVLLLTGFDLSIGLRYAVGDGLAVLSAAAFGVYSVAGRRERERYPLLLYAGLIYLLAAAWLAPAAAATFDPANYRPGNIAAIIGLAVVPLGLGHTLYNAALRRIPAAQANVLSTLEVIGGTLLVVIFLNERVSTVSIVGGAIVLLGVLAVVRRGD